MKKQLLKAKMVEKGITAGMLSDKIGINEATFSKKMNGKNEFVVIELKRIIEALDLSPAEVLDIFFSE